MTNDTHDHLAEAQADRELRREKFIEDLAHTLRHLYLSPEQRREILSENLPPWMFECYEHYKEALLDFTWDFVALHYDDYLARREEDENDGEK